MIKKITCKGYRGFKIAQTLDLAIPNGERGSGLTVLIGPNGGGKSTLAECFSKLAANNVSFTDGKRNKLAGDKVELRVEYGDISPFDEKKLTLATINEGGSEVTWSNDHADKPKIYYLPSRRVFNPYFGKGIWDRETFIRNPEDTQFRGKTLDHFTYRLFDASKKAKDFNKIFWKVLGKKLEWTIDQSDTQNYYVKIKKDDNVFHNSDGLGEGIVSLLFIVDAIFEAKSDELIVIDEPELSLHPQLQARLLEEILETTRKIQVVISTHSPNMISIDAAGNGGVIARIYEKDKSSMISCIDDKCRKYFKAYMGNINNPHIIGNDARACFFAEDGYIITEGQEDVKLYPKILNELNIEGYIPFFGFGAGGASSIEQIAYILKCLGFSRIGAIFDGDKQKDYEKFVQTYSDCDYKAWIIPADDIRNKRAICKAFKSGLLNDKHKLRPEVDKEKLKKMFNDILEFSKIHN